MHEWHEFKYYINVDIDNEGFDIDFIILTLEVYLFYLPKLFTLLECYCLNNRFMPQCISSLSK